MHKIGMEYPVWWDTDDKRPAGQHQALILDILPYKGRYTEHFNKVFKLAAPNTGRGYLEMAVKD